MSRIPVEKRVDPIGRTPITGADGVATPFYARQWQNLIDLVKSVLVLQDDSASNAARITVLEGEVAVLEATEIGGDNVDIEPALAPLSAGNITLNLSDTAVTPATYGDATNVPQITVDQKGRVTSVVNIPITGGGGGAAWTFVSSTTITAGTANVDVANLSAYDELLVLLDNCTSSSSQSRAMRVSIDNGATFLNTTADYQRFTSAGGITSVTNMGIGTATTSARSLYWQLIDKNNADDPKLVQTNDDSFFVRNTGAIDAIRIINGTVGTLSTGTVIVYGR